METNNSFLPAYEVWAFIARYEGRYEVSNRGRIRSWVYYSLRQKIYFRANPRIIKSFPNKWGYRHCRIGLAITIDKRAARVHIEVAKIFVINPDPTNKTEVNHLNGDKECNEWWNFEWVTRLESIEHAFTTGLIKPALGEAQSQTKLTNEQVLEIFNSTEKTKYLSEKYSISTHAILDIKRGRTWWHLTGKDRHYKNSDKGKYKEITTAHAMKRIKQLIT